MITAIVMISCEVDRIPEVAQAIADLDGVTEVYSVTGDADLIAMVRVRAHEEFADVIADRLNKVEGVAARRRTSRSAPTPRTTSRQPSASASRATTLTRAVSRERVAATQRSTSRVAAPVSMAAAARAIPARTSASNAAADGPESGRSARGPGRR